MAIVSACGTEDAPSRSTRMPIRPAAHAVAAIRPRTAAWRIANEARVMFSARRRPHESACAARSLEHDRFARTV
jgi:hypothetical protein